MSHSKYILGLISLVMLLLMTASALALIAPKMSRFQFGPAGESTGNEYHLVSQIGQHGVGTTLHGGEYTLSGGFMIAPARKNFFVFLPLIFDGNLPTPRSKTEPKLGPSQNR